MFVTRTSMFTGVKRTLNLNITYTQLNSWISGTLAQNAFPNITADEREFIMTGVTGEEWDDTFNMVDDDRRDWDAEAEKSGF